MFRLLRGAIVLVIAIVALHFLWAKDYSNLTLEFDESISSFLKNKGIDSKDLRYEKRETYKSGRHTFLKIEKDYSVGPEFRPAIFVKDLENYLKKTNLKIAKTIFEKKRDDEDRLSVSFSVNNKVLSEIRFIKSEYHYRPAAVSKKGDAKIAIVLDDFGYNINNLEMLFEEIGHPLTVSVLPNLPYSIKIAELASEKQFEVILHLPLEPHGEESNLEKETIMVDMSAHEMNSLLTKAIDSVPSLKGVSNHMGSRATEDRAFMRGLFLKLKKRDLYFLDNLVTDKSVCEEVAKEVSLRTVSRSIFLDNESDEAYIEKQVLQAARLADKTGWAIGIGHDRPYTVKVLAKVIPKLKREGYKFVYVSDLVE